MSERYFYTITNEANGTWRGKVYKYDPTGNIEIVVWLSDETFDSEGEAYDAATDYCDDVGIDAELD